jgi:hypothetical protein
MDIAFARGDSFDIGFQIKSDEDEDAVTDEFDEIYFTAKHRYQDRDAVLQLTKTGGSIVSDGDGYYTLHIRPTDTERLAFGIYDIDIEVNRGEYCRTFPGTMTLLREVTHYNNKSGGS